MIGTIGPQDEYLQESHPGQWLSRQIAKAHDAGKPHAICVTVDPSLAAALLEHNPTSWNRKLSPPAVEKWSEAMKRGEWALNGETVIVADTGELNDGQHRLEACIKSGCSFQTLMVFGIARDTRATLDQGKRRQMTDELYMAGYTNVANRLGAATVVIGYLNKDVGILGHGKATSNQVLAFLDDHPDIMRGAHLAYRVQQAFKVSQATMVGLHYLFAMRNLDAADLFITSIVFSGNIKVVQDPRARLAFRLRDHSLRRSRLTRPEMVAITIKAWNHWTRGESCAPLTWRAMGMDEQIPNIDEWGELQDTLLAKALKKP